MTEGLDTVDNGRARAIAAPRDLLNLQSKLRDNLHRLAHQNGVPGAAVALAVGPHVIEACTGVLNSRTCVPVRPESLFQIQSVTKMFTATLVMQLVEEGALQLDRPVTDYLADFCTADPQLSAGITVRHLLTHTGGFEGDLWAATSAGPDALEKFVDEVVSRARQVTEPGTRFSYCSAGFGVLGRIVEILRAMTYEQALRKYLMEPLGIVEAAFSADQALSFSAAIGHVHTRSGLQPSPHWALLPPSNPAAGNQLATSARGLLALGQLHLLGGRASDGTRILDTATVRSMLEPQIEHRLGAPQTNQQGLGWRLCQPGTAEHGGGAPGIAAMLKIAPSHGIAASVLTNSTGGGRLTQQLLDPLFEDLAGLPPRQPLPVPPHLTPELDVADRLGRFSTQTTLFDVSRDANGRLWLESRSQNEGLALLTAAGAPIESSRVELRRFNDNAFILVDEEDRATGSVSFMDWRGGQYQTLGAERVAVRVTPRT